MEYAIIDIIGFITLSILVLLVFPVCLYVELKAIKKRKEEMKQERLAYLEVLQGIKESLDDIDDTLLLFDSVNHHKVKSSTYGMMAEDGSAVGFIDSETCCGGFDVTKFSKVVNEHLK